MTKDKTIAVLWQDSIFYIPTAVLFVRRSGRHRFYPNVSLSSVMRLDDIRQGNDRRIRWEQHGEIDRCLARDGADV